MHWAVTTPRRPWARLPRAGPRRGGAAGGGRLGDAGGPEQHTRQVAPSLLAGYDFSRFRTVMDVGGGDGTLIAALLRAHPHQDGVLFDLPAGLKNAATTLQAAGVADRCRVVPGDFFESVPEGADALLLKMVLHDWDDQRATAILRTCRTAMAPHARLLVIEQVLPELATPTDLRALIIDLTMLVSTGGRERTEPEFRSLLEAAGFTLTRLTAPLALNCRVLEAAPAEGATTPPRQTEGTGQARRGGVRERIQTCRVGR